MCDEEKDTMRTNTRPRSRLGAGRLSCDNCRARKLRCDRKQPCSGCISRDEVDRCTWPPGSGPIAPPPRTRRTRAPRPASAPAQRTPAIQARLERLEQMAAALAQQVGIHPCAVSASSPVMPSPVSTQDNGSTAPATVSSQSPHSGGSGQEVLSQLLDRLPPTATISVLAHIFFSDAILHSWIIDRSVFYERLDALEKLRGQSLPRLAPDTLKAHIDFCALVNAIGATVAVELDAATPQAPLCGLDIPSLLDLTIMALDVSHAFGRPTIDTVRCQILLAFIMMIFQADRVGLSLAFVIVSNAYAAGLHLDPAPGASREDVLDRMRIWAFVVLVDAISSAHLRPARKPMIGHTGPGCGPSFLYSSDSWEEQQGWTTMLRIGVELIQIMNRAVQLNSRHSSLPLDQSWAETVELSEALEALRALIPPEAQVTPEYRARSKRRKSLSQGRPAGVLTVPMEERLDLGFNGLMLTLYGRFMLTHVPSSWQTEAAARSVPAARNCVTAFLEHVEKTQCLDPYLFLPLHEKEALLGQNTYLPSKWWFIVARKSLPCGLLLQHYVATRSGATTSELAISPEESVSIIDLLRRLKELLHPLAPILKLHPEQLAQLLPQDQARTTWLPVPWTHAGFPTDPVPGSIFDSVREPDPVHTPSHIDQVSTPLMSSAFGALSAIDPWREPSEPTWRTLEEQGHLEVNDTIRHDHTEFGPPFTSWTEGSGARGM